MREKDNNVVTCTTYGILIYDMTSTLLSNLSPGDFQPNNIGAITMIVLIHIIISYWVKKKRIKKD